uniref:Uncharacterized protein n=1 Tax=Anguilla anguilla TaxID=7936 RepID=A0A0E9TG13_ANGAN
MTPTSSSENRCFRTHCQAERTTLTNLNHYKTEHMF